ncbi:uncharacterized protein LOC141601207 [Silene latifolia]|uniref:uncharacterized protein LOC141601207 n=1 Tax=Silene latifolia TaxID=37657 RepID=UPI003D775293
MWTTDKGHEYTVAKGYDMLRNKGERIQWKGLVWDKFTIPKHGFLTWIYFHKGLNTNEKLHKLGISDVDTCGICGTGSESFTHLFFDCEYISRVISLLGSRIGETFPYHGTIEWRKKLTGYGTRKGIINALYNACIYYIWRQRNLCKHELTLLHPNKLVTLLIKEVTQRIMSLPNQMGARDRYLLDRMRNC